MLRPIILQFLFSNSDLRPAIYPSSVVQTGVKSFGWEKRIAHPLPIHSWKLMGPSVVSALKLGASSPIWSAIPSLLSTEFGDDVWLSLIKLLVNTGNGDLTRVDLAKDDCSPFIIRA